MCNWSEAINRPLQLLIMYHQVAPGLMLRCFLYPQLQNSLFMASDEGTRNSKKGGAGHGIKRHIIQVLHNNHIHQERRSRLSLGS